MKKQKSDEKNVITVRTFGFVKKSSVRSHDPNGWCGQYNDIRVVSEQIRDKVENLALGIKPTKS